MAEMELSDACGQSYDQDEEWGPDWLRVAPLRGGDVDMFRPSLRQRYDLAIVGVGYEARSRFIFSEVGLKAERWLALAFDSHQELSFRDNWRVFEGAGLSPEVTESRLCHKVVLREIESVGEEPSSKLNVVVDISVLDRTRIASILLGLLDTHRSMDVDFLYTPARFSPLEGSEPPVVVRDPIHERFSGWAENPDLPVALIVGLGHEHEKAVGAVEFLEPAATWAFLPRGQDEAYNEYVEVANRALFFVHPPRSCIPYEILDPFGCFESLESLVFGLKVRFRPVIVPFGPKMFALLSLIVGLLHAPDVSVWRVSSGHLQVPVDRVSDGSVTGLRLHVRPQGEGALATW